MAKIENKALDVLQKTRDQLISKITECIDCANRAESEFNKFTNEKHLFQSELENVQDAIALLSKPKKGKKDNERT